MKVMSKKGKERQIKKILVEETDWLFQHCDLLMLIALHEEFGFGAERLRRFYRKIGILHDEFKRKYMTAEDEASTENRCDTYVMKQYLKRIGFDYDAECEKVLDGGNNNGVQM